VEALNGKATGDTLAANEWNQVPTELQNVIEALGQSLTNTDLNQLGKAIAGYVGSGDEYTDGGSANSIVLSSITGLQSPPEYTQRLKVNFSKSGTNTGGVNINVAGLGVLPVLDQFGAALVPGDLVTGTDYQLRYNPTLDGGNPAFQYNKPAATTNDLPRNYIDGFTLSNNATDSANDIDIAAGTCKNSTNSADLTLVSALGKQIDVAWAEGGTPGTPAGGFPSGLTSGSPVNNTWYRIFAIRKNTGQVDAGFDTNTNAAALLADATDYSEFRQIGWIYYEAPGQIRQFRQYGDWFEWDLPTEDLTASPAGTSRILVTMTAPPDETVRVYGGAVITGATSPGDNTYIQVVPVDNTDNPSDISNSIGRYGVGASTQFDGGSSFDCRLNNSSQLAVRCSGLATTGLLAVNTQKYNYPRGKQ